MYELCVPYTVSGHDKYNKCLSFKDVTSYRSSGECEFDGLDGYSSFTIFLIGVLVISVLVFSLAVIYYNVYVKLLNILFLAYKISNTPIFCTCLHAGISVPKGCTEESNHNG